MKTGIEMSGENNNADAVVVAAYIVRIRAAYIFASHILRSENLPNDILRLCYQNRIKVYIYSSATIMAYSVMFAMWLDATIV
jgi:hypothetical protein